MIFAALCALLFLMPLPFGGVYDWTIGAFELAVFALAAAEAGKAMAGRRPARGVGDDAAARVIPAWIKALAAAFLAVTAIQLAPLPAPVVKAVSPRTLEIERPAGSRPGVLAERGSPRDGGGAIPSAAGNPASSLSLSPGLTARQLLLYLAYALFALLLFRHTRTRRRQDVLVWTILAAALFQSLYGLAEYFGGTGSIFGWKNIYSAGSASGTFVNRDHFSGFLEMAFPVALGNLLARADFLARRRGLSLRQKIVWFGHERLQRTILLGFVPLAAGLGIVFSRCLAGVIILLASLLGMSFALSIGGRAAAGRRGRRHVRLVGAVTALVLAAAALLGLRPLLARLSDDLLRPGYGRPVYYRNALDLIASFPLAGTGAGTFVHAYPLVEKADEPGLLDHAHNDYLEVLSDSGLAGGGLIVAAFAAWIFLFGRWLRRRSYFARGIGLGALLGLAAMLAHSAWDFGLRTPANAVLFAALWALAARVVPKRPGRSEGPLPAAGLDGGLGTPP